MPNAYGTGPHGASKRSEGPLVLDTMLLALADSVAGYVQYARDLVLRNGPQSAAKKRQTLRRLSRMRLASLDLREETEAPYRDARMLLTSTILGFAALVRVEQRAADLPLAEAVALTVMDLYPTLAPKFADGRRVERIRAAIASAASSAKRVPWKLIAAVWTGLQRGEPDSEAWRQDWMRYRLHFTEKGVQIPWERVVSDAFRAYALRVRTGNPVIDHPRTHDDPKPGGTRRDQRARPPPNRRARVRSSPNG